MKTNKGASRIDALPATIYQMIKDGWIEQPRKALKATRLFYVNSAYPEYIKTITWEKYTHQGEAAIVAEGSKNIPLINDYVEDVTTKVVTIKQALVISDLEQKAMAAGSSRFKASRVSAIRYNINAKIDKVIFLGDAKSKITGLFGTAGVRSHVFSKTVATMTGFELLEAVRKGKAEAIKDGLWDPNILLIPDSMRARFVEGMSADNPRTVMSYIKEEGLYDIIEFLPELDTFAASQDPAIKPFMFAIDAEPDNLEIAMVQAPNQLNEHVDEAGNVQINFGARTAGMLVYHPNSIIKFTQP